MKKFATIDFVKGQIENLTFGKKYEVLSVRPKAGRDNQDLLMIDDDAGNSRFIIEKGCFYLRGGNWTITEVPEDKEVFVRSAEGVVPYGYLTARKIYRGIIKESRPNLVYLTSDEGEEVVAGLKGSAHLNGGDWEIVEDVVVNHYATVVPEEEGGPVEPYSYIKAGKKYLAHPNSGDYKAFSILDEKKGSCFIIEGLSHHICRGVWKIEEVIEERPDWTAQDPDTNPCRMIFDEYGPGRILGTIATEMIVNPVFHWKPEPPKTHKEILMDAFDRCGIEYDEGRKYIEIEAKENKECECVNFWFDRYGRFEYTDADLSD